MGNTKLLEIVLNLFDDGAAAPATEGTASQQVETQAIPKTDRSGKTGEAKVIYGKQGAPAAEVQETPPPQKSAEERHAEYEKMLADYKDLDTERISRIIDKRFKGAKTAESQLNAAAPIIETLCERYNVKSGDLAGLQSAIDNDAAYLERGAESAGMDVQQFRRFEELRLKSERLENAQQRTEGMQKAQEEINGWLAEGEKVRAVYPAFDFRAESQNEGFLDMLKAGVPVQHAYEVLHIDDIKTGVAQYAASASEKKTVENIRSRGMRPEENGAAAQGAVTVKSNVSRLSREDRAEIARRAGKGEKIEF